MSDSPLMTLEQIENCFTRTDQTYSFARWGRPIVPVVFGVEDDTVSVVKGAIEAVVMLAGHKMAETDPELGANLMVFFFRDWAELLEVPKLEEMVVGLADLVPKLVAQNATNYRAFRFDDAGAIQACFTFVRMGAEMADQPADAIALNQAVQAILLWGQDAFSSTSPLALLPGGQVILRPEIAHLIKICYDPVLPMSARDRAHALRVFARLQQAKLSEDGADG